MHSKAKLKKMKMVGCWRIDVELYKNFYAKLGVQIRTTLAWRGMWICMRSKDAQKQLVWTLLSWFPRSLKISTNSMLFSVLKLSTV